jgi:hypothetical protein
MDAGAAALAEMAATTSKAATAAIVAMTITLWGYNVVGATAFINVARQCSRAAPFFSKSA